MLTKNSIAPRQVVKPSAPSWIKSIRRYSIVMVIPVGFEPTSPGLKVRYPSIRRENHMELPVGFEPTVRCLQGSRVTIAPQEHVCHKGDHRRWWIPYDGLVIPVRFELTSPGLRGRCPTSWTRESYWYPVQDSNPHYGVRSSASSALDERDIMVLQTGLEPVLDGV